ncbi:PepSY domain-containing protein [Plebeiibacterium sediminum]|uniref:PepSY domain-containing protein n=1 Tax=Plebeiibacterium sediminum TaxID=2992112 RepID=A0AAE3SF36_9BACT|nr:PepSY domain-containing protein [Plebeiobacterium sediminum]MCW3787123.1 PepSY domain-containing protein [Plebeiobacterium sediminum]
MRKIFFQVHKITGAIMSLMCLIWFLTGIVLIFTGYPHASREKRFLHLETFSPQEIQNLQAPDSSFKGSVELEKYLGQPVYRVSSGRKTQKVYNAQTLEPLKAFTIDQADQLASSYTQSTSHKISISNQLDQWVPWSYYKTLLPFYKCYMNDDAHSVVYVSQKTGSIIQKTTRKERWIAYFSAIPHWVYFVSLRNQMGLWKTIMIILSVLGLLASISGIAVGIYRKKKNRITPFKKFNYKWHHIFGYFFGVFVFTFILSGLISITNIPDWMVGISRKEKITWDQKLDLTKSKSIAPSAIYKAIKNKEGIRKIEWKTIFNTPYYLVYYNDYQVPEAYFLKNGSVQPANEYELSAIKKQAQEKFGKYNPEVSIRKGYDNYYSSNAMLYIPQIAYKVVLNDDAKTWLYINPQTGEEILRYNKNKRVRRWLYRALHTFNFQFLKEMDWLRKTLLIIVSIAGIIICYTGLILSKKFFKQILNIKS